MKHHHTVHPPPHQQISANWFYLSQLEQFAIHTSCIMRPQAYDFYLLDADLEVNWLSDEQSYRIHAKPHSIECVHGWACPSTLMQVIHAFAARLLSMHGHAWFVYTHDLPGEASAGVPFTMQCKAVNSPATVPDWQGPVHIIEISSTVGSDLLRQGLSE